MIKKILGELKEYRAAAIMTPLGMIGEVIFETIIPLLIAHIVDDGIMGGSVANILKYGGLMLLMAMFALICGIIGNTCAAKASSGLAKNLRATMFRKIQTFSFANIDRFSTSGLVTRLTTDVTNIQMAFQMMVRMLFRAPFSMVVAMIMAYSISPRLSRIYLIAIVFLATFLIILMGTTAKLFGQVFKKYDDLNESVEENVAAIRVVKSYVREDHEINRFKKAADNIYKLFIKAEKRVVLNMPVMQFTVNACIILISWFGARMIVNNDGLTTGGLMSLLTYCMMILMSLMMLAMVFIMVVMSAASARRIDEVLSEECTIKDPENPISTVKDGSIVFDDVDFAYSNDAHESVLKDVSLDIKSGETIGIIGGTGSAKTTLISLICRLYDTTSGTVSVGGQDVHNYSQEVLRESISVVLQKNELFTGSILDNLRWGNPDATLEECKEACKAACADSFIENFPDGYETHIEQGGANVSGGQKQRLCIARALLKKPKILILDDSMSAVDTATEAKIKAGLASYKDMTKLIVTQRISAIESADRVIVLDEGRVSGFDTPENLLKTNRIYAEVYETQTGAGGDFDEQGGKAGECDG